MPKTRASFSIAEDDEPLRKRPRRSCNATGAGVLKELDDNAPQPRRSRELKKAAKLKSKKEAVDAPKSRSKRVASEDAVPKKRELPKRKGRGVPPLRLQDEIIGDEESERDEEEEVSVAPSVVNDAPRRRSSARIQKQITDKPTEPEKWDGPGDREKSEQTYQTKTRNNLKGKKVEEDTKSNPPEGKGVETGKKKRNLENMVETLKKRREIGVDNSCEGEVKTERELAVTVEVKPEPQRLVKHEVKRESQNDPSSQEEPSPPPTQTEIETRLRPRPPIKVKFVDDEELSDSKGLMYDFLTPTKAPAPVLRTPITFFRDDSVFPVIDLTDEMKEQLVEGRTTLGEVHRAFMGLELEKSAFQPAMPERPKIFDDIEAADREQEEKMRELRRNLKAEAPDCDCGRRGRSK